MALTDNLVAYWKLDEAAGDCEDETGTNDGTVNGADYGADGVIEHSMTFVRANNDYINVGSNASLNITTEDFSVNFWVKGDGTWVINESLNMVTSGQNRWSVYLAGEAGSSNKYLTLGKPGTDEHRATTSIADSAWTMCTVVYDQTNNNIYFYKNGTADANNPHAYASTFNAIDSVYIGRSPWNGATHRGYIDEMGIWKGKLLTQEEITTLYNGGAGLTYPFSTWDGKRVQINIGDSWKEATGELKINIGDSWKEIEGMQINIGDSWKEVY